MVMMAWGWLTFSGKVVQVGNFLHQNGTDFILTQSGDNILAQGA